MNEIKNVIGRRCRYSTLSQCTIKYDELIAPKMGAEKFAAQQDEICKISSITVPLINGQNSCMAVLLMVKLESWQDC